MTLRDANAIAVADSDGEIEFSIIARGLHDAVLECLAEGVQYPASDPAVKVLGAFVMFHTHSDVSTAGGYRDQLELCRQRHEQTQVLQ